MPPAKSRLAHEDSRSDGSTVRERQIAAAAHARKAKNGASAHTNASSLKELAMVNADSGNVVGQGQGVRCEVRLLHAQHSFLFPLVNTG